MPSYAVAEPPPDDLAPILPFDDFLTYVFRWTQDQHIAVIGPTEQGKTNLVGNLVSLRQYVAYMGIKSEDATLEKFIAQLNFKRTMDWPPQATQRSGMAVAGSLVGAGAGAITGGLVVGAKGILVGAAGGAAFGAAIGAGLAGGPRKRELTWQEMPKRLVWPDARAWNHEEEQRRVFGNMVQDIWSSGRACVVWADFWYLAALLKMERDAKKMLLNARSCFSAQVIEAQRAGGNRMVELVDQPTWLFWAKENDPRNLQLLGATSSVRRGFVEHLDRYQFLAENTRSGDRYRITAPLL